MKVKKFFKEARKEMEKDFKENLYGVKKDILKCIEAVPENAEVEKCGAIVINYITGKAKSVHYFDLIDFLENKKVDDENEPWFDNLDFSKVIIIFGDDYYLEEVFCIFSEETKVYAKIRSADSVEGVYLTNWIEEDDFFLRNYSGYEGVVEEKDSWEDAEILHLKFNWSFFE